MKFHPYILLVALLAVAVGGEILLWDANPPGDGVTNYVVGGGPSSRGYSTQWNVGAATSAPLPRVAGFYAVRAESEFGGGAWSREILYVPSPELSRVKLRLFAKDAVAGEWREFAAIPLTGTNEAEFFQLRITR